MRYILLLLFISLVISFPVASDAEDANDGSIQGTWYLSGQVDSKDGHGLSWFLEWTFDHSKFNLNGYPPLHQEGSYRIVKTEGNKLTLELYDQKGNFGTENSRIEIVVDKEKDTLMIKGQGPFKRTKASR
jgi:hypothetical protein